MKILLTGATGFIGSHLLKQLLEQGDDVRITVRPGSNKTNLAGTDRDRVEMVQGDLADPEFARRALEGCRRLYHLAGLVSTLKKDVPAIWKSNYDSTVNLFQAGLKQGLEKVVYLASIFALGKGTREKPADENIEYNLGNWDIPYFQAKRKAEVEAYRFSREGLPIVFIYPTFCFGPGDVYLSSGGMVVQFMKSLMPVYPKGGFNAIDVRDTARGLRLGMERGRAGEKYIVGNENLEFRRFFETLAGVTGRRPPRIPIPTTLAKVSGFLLEKIWNAPPVDLNSARTAGDFWYYDSSRAKRELGLDCRDLRETLSDAVDWFRENKYF
ncbi:MAG: SDR family oxidoreductase [bacterium]|nr:SDR family oxidoreductase [bacterium]